MEKKKKDSLRQLNDSQDLNHGKYWNARTKFIVNVIIINHHHHLHHHHHHHHHHHLLYHHHHPHHHIIIITTNTILTTIFTTSSSSSSSSPSSHHHHHHFMWISPYQKPIWYLPATRTGIVVHGARGQNHQVFNGPPFKRLLKRDEKAFIQELTHQLIAALDAMLVAGWEVDVIHEELETLGVTGTIHKSCKKQNQMFSLY